MKKRVFGRKLSRSQGARRALFRGLIRALVVHGKIVTSKAKAKNTQVQIEKLVNLAKNENVAKRRQIYAILGNDKITTDNLFKKIVPAFKNRVGGYTRVINLPRRRGDSAEMARLEWVEEIVQVQEQDQVKSIAKKSKTKDELALKAGSRKRSLLKRVRKTK